MSQSYRLQSYCVLMLLLGLCVLGCFPQVPVVDEAAGKSDPKSTTTPSQSEDATGMPSENAKGASESSNATGSSQSWANGSSQVTPAQIDAMIQAAAQGDVASVQRSLQQGIPINSVNGDGNSALMMAAFEGHALVVDVLLKSGAKVDLANPLNRTALMFGATGTSAETVELLLKAGANVNAQDGHENWTPLMFAASEGHIDVIQKILAYKPKLDLVDTDGDSAYAFAAQKNHTAVLELLDEYRKSNP